MTRVFVYGAGRCGLALARALGEAGHELVGVWSRSPLADLPWPTFDGPGRPASLDTAEVVWLTVPDGAIAQVAHVPAPDQIALHASGALPAEVLREAGCPAQSVAACHPLQSYADRDAPAAHSRGIAFGIQGEPDAVATATDLVRSLGSRPFVVADAEAKALYHAACCVASNALVALADRAVTLFAAAGVDRAEALAALAPLIEGTAHNLAGAAEARAVLTGPIARGDERTVARHEQAITARAPAELEAYRAVCSEIRRLVDARDA